MIIKSKLTSLNYLAHIVLSGKNSKIRIGNFVGDAVKGRNYENYHPGIREGILLHRKIDEFTDNHWIVREMIQQIRPYFGRYSGIIADIYFDYILANNFKEFTTVRLLPFALGFYVSTLIYYRHLPVRFKKFLWHFILSNRLCKYSRIEGIRETLMIMVEYKNLRIDPEEAVTYLVQNEKYIKECFSVFFPDICQYVNKNR